MAGIAVNADGSISVDPTGISESHYLIDSNRQKCKQIFSKSEWRDGELVDGYIALHIVLEASLNSLFRQLTVKSLVKSVDELEVMQNIDKISFIDKTILFIYNSRFNFGNELADANKYHGVIKKLRAFCEIRNQLLHGHAIATITDSSGVRRDSVARGNINYDRLVQQLNDFRFIIDGVNFFVSHLDGISEAEKRHYRQDFLDYSFLPIEIK